MMHLLPSENFPEQEPKVENVHLFIQSDGAQRLCGRRKIDFAPPDLSFLQHLQHLFWAPPNTSTATHRQVGCASRGRTEDRVREAYVLEVVEVLEEDSPVLVEEKLGGCEVAVDEGAAWGFMELCQSKSGLTRQFQRPRRGEAGVVERPWHEVENQLARAETAEGSDVRGMPEEKVDRSLRGHRCVALEGRFPAHLLYCHGTTLPSSSHSLTIHSTACHIVLSTLLQLPEIVAANCQGGGIKFRQHVRQTALSRWYRFGKRLVHSSTFQCSDSFRARSIRIEKCRFPLSLKRSCNFTSGRNVDVYS
mmetsp:Transcript_52852/g.123797  ORF Transcript_52852/g.123797 Transcript_52852/m.123797 type:complete len:306 (-) Transcript_52852:198-1115(-)